MVDFMDPGEAAERLMRIECLKQQAETAHEIAKLLVENRNAGEARRVLVMAGLLAQVLDVDADFKVTRWDAGRAQVPP